jgi:hypothetical protein
VLPSREEFISVKETRQDVIGDMVKALVGGCRTWNPINARGGFLPAVTARSMTPSSEYAHYTPLSLLIQLCVLESESKYIVFARCAQFIHVVSEYKIRTKW